jgi:superkiller protein 3
MLSAARYNLGLLYRRRGRSAEAIASWQKTVTADPRFLPAHLALARELAQTGAAEDSIPHYRAVLAEIPTYEEALIGLGDQLAALQRVDEACQQYRNAAGGDLSRLGHSRRALCIKKEASPVAEPGGAIQ